MEVLTQLGMGGGAGFVLGYALKKMFKAFLVLLGLYFATLLYLANSGYIEINYNKVLESLQNFNVGVAGIQFINVPLAGFAVGFLIGFKAG